MSTILALLISLALLHLSSACPPSVPSTLHYAPTTRLTFTPANRTISVAPHTVFHLLLKSNPTTGYTWSLHPSTSITPALAITACHYRQHMHGPGMVGVGGEEVWEVEVGVELGVYELALQYSRGWEVDKKEADVVWTVRVAETAAAARRTLSMRGTTAVE